MPTRDGPAGSAASSRRTQRERGQPARVQPVQSPAVGNAGRAGALILALQGVGLISAGLFLAIRATRPGTSDVAAAEVLGVLALLTGVGLVLAARAWVTAHRWVRGPVVVAELICLPVAVSLFQGGRWYAAVPLAVVAIVVLALLARSGLLSPVQDG